MSISQEIQDAIQKGLPGMVAGELKDFIAQAERTAKDLDGTKASLALSQDKVAALNAQLEQHRSIDEKQAKLEATARANQETELALLKREAGLDAKIALAELGGVKETMNSFLRNVSVRQTVVSDVAKPVDGVATGPNGNYGMPGTLQRTVDTVTKTEEPQ